MAGVDLKHVQLRFHEALDEYARRRYRAVLIGNVRFVLDDGLLLRLGFRLLAEGAALVFEVMIEIVDDRVFDFGSNEQRVFAWTDRIDQFVFKDGEIRDNLIDALTLFGGLLGAVAGAAHRVAKFRTSAASRLGHIQIPTGNVHLVQPSIYNERSVASNAALLGSVPFIRHSSFQLSTGRRSSMRP